MKKFLLPLFLLAGAMSVNAQEVYFEDNFDWLKPWVEAHDLGDPVGTNDPDANGVSITASDYIGTNGGNIFHEMMDQTIVVAEEKQFARKTPGYLTRIWDGASNYWTFMAYDGYLRIGSNGFNGGLRTPNFNIPGNPTELYLEFDWAPCKDDEGCFHDVVLDVEYRPGNILVADDILNPLFEQDSEPLQWFHECIDLLATPGVATGDNCNVVIEASKSWGMQMCGLSNFYLDNIRVSNKPLPAAVNEIAVDNDSNKPVEYFNLQGVRVANPENGIFIRRQGSKVTKVVR